MPNVKQSDLDELNRQIRQWRGQYEEQMARREADTEAARSWDAALDKVIAEATGYITPTPNGYAVAAYADGYSEGVARCEHIQPHRPDAQERAENEIRRLHELVTTLAERLTATVAVAKAMKQNSDRR